MKKDRFAFDFGVPSPSLLSCKRVTNPAELLWSAEWERLHILCHEKTSDHAGPPSDFEAFASIAARLSEMDGHPMQKDTDALWAAYFPDLPPLRGERAVELWREACRHLEMAPDVAAFLPAAPWNCKLPTVEPMELPQGARPMLDGDLLLETTAQDVHEWHARISEAVTANANAGCRQVFMTLPRAFSFVPPDVYHVSKALQAKKRTAAEEACLVAQLLRELSAACREKDLILLLTVACRGEEAVALLRHTEAQVGLPHICWMCRDPLSWNPLLELQAEPHEKPMDMALFCADLVTDGEMREALRRTAARLPIDRLQLVTGTDACLLPFAQARVLENFENMRKNL